MNKFIQKEEEIMQVPLILKEAYVKDTGAIKLLPKPFY